MALTPEIRAPQSGLIAAVRQSAQEMNLPQAQVLVAYNIPAEEIRVTYGGSNVIYRRFSQQMQVTSSQVMIVGRGKIENPRLKSWWYTLDGHDNFILRLGTTGKTLVFDVTTGQWAWWASPDSSRWRANVGMNWKSSGSIPGQYGSNVIVGDDSYGVLWVLDPEKGADDPLFGSDETPFLRVATGQMITKDRNTIPVYSVDLTASSGYPYVSANTVTLEYSDDQGNTYVSADEPQVSVQENYNQGFTWRSLGQIRYPGRLFKITDNGAFSRIDSLDVNE